MSIEDQNDKMIAYARRLIRDDKRGELRRFVGAMNRDRVWKNDQRYRNGVAMGIQIGIAPGAYPRLIRAFNIEETIRDLDPDKVGAMSTFALEKLQGLPKERRRQIIQHLLKAKKELGAGNIRRLRSDWAEPLPDDKPPVDAAEKPVIGILGKTVWNQAKYLDTLARQLAKARKELERLHWSYHQWADREEFKEAMFFLERMEKFIRKIRPHSMWDNRAENRGAGWVPEWKWRELVNQNSSRD